MNPVVHFEIPYDDAERAAAFYEAAFGWRTQRFGEEMGNYVVVTTTESDPQTGRPTTPGAINGGLFARSGQIPDAHPSVVIAVDDIESAVQTVASSGGEVLGEPMDIPGVGRYVSFMDTEGNRVALLQPAPMMAQQGG